MIFTIHQLISRDTAELPTYVESNNRLVLNSLESITGGQEIKNNVYPYGGPQIAEVGQGKYLLVWLDHDSERYTDENATALYYSYYNGEYWSEPLVVDEDGTCDFAPSIVAYEEGALLAWQNSEVEYDEGVLLDELTSTIGITSARFEDGIFTINQITEPDQSLESAPILVTDGSAVTVVWSKNSENDVFGVEGDNAIYQSSYLGGKWSEPEDVYTEAGYIGAKSAAMKAGTLYIAYAKDMDGEIGNSTDDEIMLIVGDADPVQVTKNEFMNTNAKLIVNEGKVALYWYEEESIHYKPDVTGEEQRKILTSEYAGMNFDVITNGRDQAIIWEEADGFSTNLKAIYYDTTSYEWGDVKALTSQKDKISETKAIITEEGNLSAVFILADLLEEYSEEVSPYGECSLVLLQQEPGYDLAIEGNILYDDAYIKEGSAINLGIFLENRGQKAIDGFVVQMLREGEVVQTQEVSAHMLAGDGDYYEIPYQLEKPFEAHTLDICVLPLNQTDLMIVDNSASVMLGMAHITLDELSITGNKASRNVRFEIFNSGYIDSDTLYIEMLQSDGDNEEVKATTVIDSVGKQDSTYAEFELSIASDLFTAEDILEQLIYIKVYDYNTMEELDYIFTNLQ